MNAAVATAIAFAVYLAGYLFYSRYLAEHVFALDPDRPTPAHEQTDGVDYVPTRKSVLFGHHYASIAGLAPMLGPAVAVIWGWLPAMAWVVLGALFVGCVHDFGSLVVSIRARGKSIGAVAEGIIGSRAKTLLHAIIFFLVALAMGVFVWVIAFLFSPAPEPAQSAYHFPQAVLPSFGLMVIASTIGWLGYRHGVSWKVMTPIGFVLLLALVYVAQTQTALQALGVADPTLAPSISGWSTILLGYAFAASILPVWVLLQPRDFLNVLLLFLGLGGLYLGVFVGQPDFVAPAVQTNPEGAPSMFPFVFIIIACGAASGFHSLVSSGTTAKQLDTESDARVIGYGGMIGESLLGLIAVLATTAGMADLDAWKAHYGTWEAANGLGQKVSVFIQGSSEFLGALTVPEGLGASFISVIVVSYALTSLDSATRLLRYNVEEIGETLGVRLLANRYVSSAIAAGAIGFFAFYEVNGQPAGLVLWSLFGTTNQLMAGLALLVITLYLLMRDRPWQVAGIPMIAMLGTTLWAMASNLWGFTEQGTWLSRLVSGDATAWKVVTEWAATGKLFLFGVGTVIFLLGVWTVVEAILAVHRFVRSDTTLETLLIELDE